MSVLLQEYTNQMVLHLMSLMVALTDINHSLCKNTILSTEIYVYKEQLRAFKTVRYIRSSL